MSKLTGVKLFGFVLIAVRLLLGEVAAAFTVPTHEELTERAAQLSILEEGNLLTATFPEF